MENVLNNLFEQKDEIDWQLIKKDTSKGRKRVLKYWKDSEELRNKFSMYMLPKALLESIYRYLILDKEILTELASRVDNPEKTNSKRFAADSARTYEIIQRFRSIIEHPKKITINMGSKDKPCLIEINNPDRYPIDRSVPETFAFDGKHWKVELKLPKIFFNWSFLEKPNLREEYLRKLENNKIFSSRLYNDFQLFCQLDSECFDDEQNLFEMIFNDIEGLTYYLEYAKAEFREDMYIGVEGFEIIFKEISIEEDKEEIHWHLNKFIPFEKSANENLIQNIYRLLM